MRIRDGGAKRDYIFFYFSLLKVGIKGICEDALFCSEERISVTNPYK